MEISKGQWLAVLIHSRETVRPFNPAWSNPAFDWLTNEVRALASLIIAGVI